MLSKGESLSALATRNGELVLPESGDVACGDLDDQVGIQRTGRAFQYWEGGNSAAGLKAGDC